MIEDTKITLKLWGNWSRGGLAIGKIKSCIQIYCDANLGSTVKSQVMSDEEAREIEEIVLELMSSNSEAADILCLFYVVNLPLYTIQKKRNISNARADKLLSFAIGFVDGQLSRSRKIHAA